MKTTIFSFVLFPVALLFGSCEKHERPAPDPGPAEDFIRIDVNSVNLSPKAYDLVDVKVRSSGDWTLSGGCDWVAPAAMKGKNFGMLTFSVSENTAFEPRSVEYTFSAGTASVKFTINQEANDVLTRDSEGTYELQTLKDWTEFVEIVNKAVAKANKEGVQTEVINAKMERDIDLGNEQTQIAVCPDGADYGYNGTFDGQGHTLKINYKSVNDDSPDGFHALAPFNYTDDATIKNLRIAGTITTNQARSCGLVSFVNSGTTTIERCWSSVAILINGRNGTWYDGGGLTGTICNGAKVFIKDCLFDGKMISTTSAEEFGGMVGWARGSSEATLENCLFAPEKLELNTASSGTFYAGSGSKVLDNLWYTMTLGEAQGADASALTAAQLVEKLNAGRADGPWKEIDGKVVLGY